MKTIRKYSVFCILSVTTVVVSCRKDEKPPEPTALGIITVDLDANDKVIRKKESLIGNMITDAIKKYIVSKGKPVDMVVVNSGSIRYKASSRPDGIYPAGTFTAEMVDEMLPFQDAPVLVTLTGRELKAVFERAVAQYPLLKGPFPQISEYVQISVDTNAAPQVINISETQIISPGNRIRSIKINEADIDSAGQYLVAFPSFIADGNDGFVTLKNLSSAQKENLIENQSNAVKEYIILKTPLRPELENRIVFQ
jgi:2',3'-cyclic-nucleotide 2'-phosphodiesterase (5'-nucleotidase family)